MKETQAQHTFKPTDHTNPRSPQQHPRLSTPRGKIARGTAGTARRQVSRCPCAHESPNKRIHHVQTAGGGDEGSPEVKEKGRVKEVSYKYCMKVIKPDDDAKGLEREKMRRKLRRYK